jgi:phytoene synthase
MSLTQAHRRCAQITRTAAANFYYGIALLPPSKRAAMCAIYAFARRIDDIGDGDLPDEQKLTQLEEQRRGLAVLAGNGGQDMQDGDLAPLVADGAPGVHGAQDAQDSTHDHAGDPVLVSLADSHRRFELPLDALSDLIDGVHMDVVGERYETFDHLVLYSRRVAGSIGRLCLAIFGSHDLDSAWTLADDLGVAMQLTNILRDLREDAQRGRVYLPSEDLVRYHLHDSAALDAAELLALAQQGAHADPEVVAGFDGEEVGQLFALMRYQALRAHDWFGRGMALVPLLDRRSAACVMAMTGIYRKLLWQIQDHPDRALAARMSLPTCAKATVAVKSMLRPHRVPERHPAERVL